MQDTEATTPVDVRTTRHTNGKIATRATYSDNQLIGVWRAYDTDGIIKSGAVYEENRKVADGITDDQGLRTGWWTWYDAMGNIKVVWQL